MNYISQDEIEHLRGATPKHMRLIAEVKWSKSFDVHDDIASVGLEVYGLLLKASNGAIAFRGFLAGDLDEQVYQFQKTGFCIREVAALLIGYALSTLEDDEGAFINEASAAYSIGEALVKAYEEVTP